MNARRFWFVTGLAVFAALSRVFPHPWNFTPVGAVALFGAATIPSRRLAAVVPIAALLASDCLLQLTYRAGWQPSWGFYRGQWVIYLAVLAGVGLGYLLRGRRTAPNVAAAALANSVSFFLVTNCVFFYQEGPTYPANLHGLLASYEAALPFFRNSLAGDAFYTAVLFGTLALAEARFPKLRPVPAGAP